MPTIHEPAREIPVMDEVDLCVLGGSCTGVFAAVAAARLGLRVAIVEKMGFFGGVATAALVNIWHSLKSTDGEQTTIAGMTRETIERVAEYDGVNFKDELRWSGSFHLNTEVLKLVLDQMVVDAGVRPFLHTRFAAPILNEGRPIAAAIEDKTGRRAIRADYFIDATGDGDFIERAGLPTRKDAHIQPPSVCAIFRNLSELSDKHPEFSSKGFPGLNLREVIFHEGFEESIRKGQAWWNQIPGSRDETLLVGTRVFGADCSDADELTKAELEGRGQLFSIMKLFRNNFMDGKGQPLVNIAAQIGIRMSRQARCLHCLNEQELLHGERFDDAIANGTYPVDIHHTDGEGITFRWLDGTERGPNGQGRWLPEGEKAATFYQIPYRSLVPQGATNVLVAGRLVDADPGAFGAIRVMVNCNQTGEAAGTAVALARNANQDVSEVDPKALREQLGRQGAAIL